MAWIGSLLKNWKLIGTLGAGATGYGYYQSGQAEAQDMADGKLDNAENGAFKRSVNGFVQENVLPVVGHAVQGVSGIVTDTVKTASGIGQQAAKEAPGVATQAGAAVGAALETTEQAGNNFFSGFVPKGWEGIATAAAGALGLGALASTGIAGAGVKNLAGNLMAAPAALVQGAFGMIASGLSPLISIIGAVVVGWAALTENGREFIGGIFEKIKGMLGFEKSPATTPETAPYAPAVPAPAPIPPSQEVVPDGPVVKRELQGISLASVSGGHEASEISGPTKVEIEKPRRETSLAVTP